MNWSELKKLSLAHGDAFYLLDSGQFEQNYQSLLDAFNKFYPDVQIGYSYKTNYIPHLCKLIDKLGGYAEVVSEMEYALAQKIGVSRNRIIFNGPNKSKSAFTDAMLNGATVNLDSTRDLNMFVEIARSNPNKQFDITIRTNFSIGNDSVSRFGFDTDGEVFRNAIDIIEQAENTSLAGFHCHFPDRDLQSYGRRASVLIELAKKYFPNKAPKHLNIGGGYFGRLPDTLKNAYDLTQVSYEEYGQIIGDQLLAAYPDPNNSPTLFIEPGTAIVADTMSFVTEVIDVKTVQGRNIATVSGSIFNISPTARTQHLPFVVHKKDSQGTSEHLTEFDIGGFTCIEGDYLSRNVDADIQVGDFLEYSNVGSYSIVMKPPFILPNVPIVSRCNINGEHEIHKERETMEYIFQNFHGT
ncbi:MAG: decarboxylase [Rhodothermales bacterium]